MNAWNASFEYKVCITWYNHIGRKGYTTVSINKLLIIIISQHGIDRDHNFFKCFEVCEKL